MSRIKCLNFKVVTQLSCYSEILNSVVTRNIKAIYQSFIDTLTLRVSRGMLLILKANTVKYSLCDRLTGRSLIFN